MLGLSYGNPTRSSLAMEGGGKEAEDRCATLLDDRRLRIQNQSCLKEEAVWLGN